MTDTAAQTSATDAPQPPPLSGILATIALILAPLSPVTWYVGIGIAALVLVYAIVSAFRGFQARGLQISGGLALVISLGVSVAWNSYVATETEVSGAARIEQQQAESAFDKAFENADTIPGIKDGGS